MKTPGTIVEASDSITAAITASGLKRRDMYVNCIWIRTNLAVHMMVMSLVSMASQPMRLAATVAAANVAHALPLSIRDEQMMTNGQQSLPTRPFHAIGLKIMMNRAVRKLIYNLFV